MQIFFFKGYKDSSKKTHYDEHTLVFQFRFSKDGQFAVFFPQIIQAKVVFSMSLKF